MTKLFASTEPNPKPPWPHCYNLLASLIIVYTFKINFSILWNTAFVPNINKFKLFFVLQYVRKVGRVISFIQWSLYFFCYNWSLFNPITIKITSKFRLLIRLHAGVKVIFRIEFFFVCSSKQALNTGSFAAPRLVENWKDFFFKGICFMFSFFKEIFQWLLPFLDGTGAAFKCQ